MQWLLCCEPQKIARPLPAPLSLSHRYCIDHNNVSGDTAFHGHSSETELHKPFTTRPPWWMAGPPAKAPRPDRSAFLCDKCHQKDIRHLPISYCFKWEYVCERRSEGGKTERSDIHSIITIWEYFLGGWNISLWHKWAQNRWIHMRTWSPCCVHECVCVCAIEMSAVILWNKDHGGLLSQTCCRF